MAKYKIEVFSKNNVALGDISALVSGLTWSKTRNDAESVEFELDLLQFENYIKKIGFAKNPFEFLEAGRSEIKLCRNNKPLLVALVQKLDYSITTNGAKIKVAAYGYLNFYKTIYHDINFTNTPQQEILWRTIEEINQKPGGDCGIRRGEHIGKTIKRDRNFKRKEVKSFIQQMSEVIGGVDFEITPEKKFNTYDAIGVYRPDVRLEFPKNIGSVKFPRSINSTFNFIYGIGSGNGDDAIQISAGDSLSISEYYRREKIASYNSVVNVKTLDENIRAVLAASKDIFELPSVSVGDGVLDLSKVSVGDTIVLNLDNYLSIKHISGNYRIEAIKVSVDSNGAESVDLTFDDLNIDNIISAQANNE